MAKLILIRHSTSQPIPGQSAHTWQLTDEGRIRCQLLADHLQHYQPTRLFSSAEPKAIQTAEALAERFALTNTVVPQLHETRRENAAYYADHADFQAAIHEAMQNPDTVCFGEEAFGAATKRMTKALQSLIAAHPDETMMAVTHGTAMSLFIAANSALPVYEVWHSLEMPAYAVFDTGTLHLDELKSTLTD